MANLSLEGVEAASKHQGGLPLSTQAQLYLKKQLASPSTFFVSVLKAKDRLPGPPSLENTGTQRDCRNPTWGFKKGYQER